MGPEYAPRGAILAGLLLIFVSCAKPTPDPWLTAVELPFAHSSGAKGDFYMPEIMGSGVALIDYDNDGDLDIFLLQGHPAAGSNQLLRNDGGQFTDTTKQAGLELTNYGMGAATNSFCKLVRPIRRNSSS